MTRVTKDHEALWRALFRVQGGARRKADAALAGAGLPGLEVYDVLLELDRPGAARDGLTAKELEARLLLPQYGISRLVSRLTQQGLIRQAAHPGDGRAKLLFITPEGHGLRRRMWGVYGAVIAGFVADRLSPAETARLTALLGKLGPK